MVGHEQQSAILNLANQMLPLVRQQGALVFLKDQHNKYLACNQNYAKLLGYDNDEQIIGKQDIDVNPLHAQIYLQDDQRVLQGQVLEVNNPAYFKSLGIVYVAGTMLPLKDDTGNVVGILGQTTLTHALVNKTFPEAMRLLNHTTIPLIVNKNRYLVNTKYGMVSLSKREVECILFLFKSQTTDLIAQSLDLAKRTIDSYLVSIKNKLNVSAKGDIIDAVIVGGLLEQL